MASRQAGGPYGRGAFRFTWNGEGIYGGILAAQERGAHNAGKDAVEIAQALAPVRTGLLKSQLDYEVRKTRSGIALVLKNETEYSAYQELGTVNHPAQPHMRPAADAVFPQYGQYVKAELK